MDKSVQGGGNDDGQDKEDIAFEQRQVKTHRVNIGSRLLTQRVGRRRRRARATGARRVGWTGWHDERPARLYDVYLPTYLYKIWPKRAHTITLGGGGYVGWRSAGGCVQGQASRLRTHARQRRADGAAAAASTYRPRRETWRPPTDRPKRRAAATARRLPPPLPGFACSCRQTERAPWRRDGGGYGGAALRCRGHRVAPRPPPPVVIHAVASQHAECATSTTLQTPPSTAAAAARAEQRSRRRLQL